MQLVLLGRKGEVEKNPQDQSGPALTEEFQVERTYARVECDAHEIVVEPIAGAFFHSASGPAMQIEKQAKDKREDVHRGQQWTELVVDDRRRNPSEQKSQANNR